METVIRVEGFDFIEAFGDLGDSFLQFWT